MTIPKGLLSQIKGAIFRTHNISKVEIPGSKHTWPQAKLSTWQVIEADVNRNVPSFKAALKNEWRLIKSTFFGAPRNRVQVLPVTTFVEPAVVVKKAEVAPEAAKTSPLPALPRTQVLVNPVRVKPARSYGSVQASSGQKPLDFDTVLRLNQVANRRAEAKIAAELAKQEAELTAKVAVQVTAALTTQFASREDEIRKQEREAQALAHAQVRVIKKAVRTGVKPEIAPKPAVIVEESRSASPESQVVVAAPAPVAFNLQAVAEAKKRKQEAAEARRAELAAKKAREVKADTGRVHVKQFQIVSPATAQNNSYHADLEAAMAKVRAKADVISHSSNLSTVTEKSSDSDFTPADWS